MTIKEKHVAYWKMMRDEGKKMAGKISVDQVFAFEMAWLTIKHAAPDVESLRREYKHWKGISLQPESSDREKQCAVTVCDALHKLADNLKNPEGFSFTRKKKEVQGTLFS